MKNSKLLPAIGIGTIAVLAACSEPPLPEEIVAERAQARWNAVIEKDFEAAWAFYSPGFRQQNDEAVFRVDMARRPVQWQSAGLESVQCEEARCEAEFTVGYKAVGAPGVLSGFEGERTVDEIWIEIDGQWWYAK